MPGDQPTASKVAAGKGSEMTPIVLMHGVGGGLLPYLSLLFKLAATGEWGGRLDTRLERLIEIIDCYFDSPNALLCSNS